MIITLTLLPSLLLRLCGCSGGVHTGRECVCFCLHDGEVDFGNRSYSAGRTSFIGPIEGTLTLDLKTTTNSLYSAPRKDAVIEPTPPAGLVDREEHLVSFR